MRTGLMKRFVLSIPLLLCASFANASPVDPTKCSFGHILVGNSSGADMGNGFQVVTRDVGNVPVSGVTVAFFLLGSGARVDVDQEAGSTVNCTAGTLSRVTMAQAQTTFHARIAGYENGQLVQLRANGILLGTIQVRSTDINGDGATDLRDLNAFRERFVLDHSAPETDFNQDGVTNGFDFELLRAEFVRGVKNTVCP